MKKATVIFCAVEPYRHWLVSERYELSQVYAFEYLAAYARKRKRLSEKYNFKIKRFGRDAFDGDVVGEIVEMEPYLVGLSCTLKNFKRITSVARQLKLARPDVKIAVGGPEAFAAKRILEEHAYVDYVVTGEGERAFADLLAKLADERAPSSIKGVSYRDGNVIRVNPPGPPLKSLNAIPSIITPELAKKLSGIVLYETARGCRHACTYCLWSPYPKRYFSLGRVKKELDVLLKNKAITRIWFIDSDFDSDPERAIEILEHVKRNRRNDVQISAFLNFDSCDERLIDLVAELFFEIPIGLQTVNSTVLRAINRTWFSVPRFEKTLDRILKKLPPSLLYVDLMYGLPGDNFDSFMESLEWCVARGLTHVNFFRLGIFPGSRLDARAAADHGFVYDPEPPHLVYSSDTFTYDDILRIENAVVNFKILASLLDGAGINRVMELCDFADLLDNLQECTPDYNDHFTMINESNVAGINAPALERHVLAFLKRKTKSTSAASEIEELISPER